MVDLNVAAKGDGQLVAVIVPKNLIDYRWFFASNHNHDKCKPGLFTQVDSFPIKLNVFSASISSIKSARR